MKSFGTEGSRAVIRKLEESGYEAVYVGGAVRNLLLGEVASDFDIATSALPAEVQAIFPRTIDVGAEHGTIIVQMKGESIEVTTYRTESTYSDHRRPDAVHFVRSLKDDLRRRDFTMNAMALTIEGRFIDPFQGQQDIENRIIRAVGDPVERFKEDALRIFRAIRFAAVLDFQIEEQTFAAMTQLAPHLQHVSVERLKQEWDKIFVGKCPQRAFHYLDQSGVIQYVPALQTMNFDQVNLPQKFHSALEGWAYVMMIGAVSPTRLASAYKMSKLEKKFLQQVTTCFAEREHRPFEKISYYHYPLEVLLTTERIVQAIHPETTPIPSDEIRQQISNLPIRSKEDLAVTGKDLMAWTDQKAGPWIGEWLQAIEYAVLFEQCENAPDKIKEWLADEYKLKK